MQLLVSTIPIDQLGKQAIGLTDESISELNRGQLRDGKTATRTLPEYSQTSVMVYGKEPGLIKLYDTGSFYNSFNVNINNDSLEIKADDPNDLIGRYSRFGDILRLSDESQSNYNENIFYPEFAKLIEQKTGLQFK